MPPTPPTPQRDDGPAPHQCGRECALVRSFFTLHTLMMRVGDRLTKPIGLTGSRWLLLGAIGNAEAPPSIGDLSAHAMLSVQNVSRMLASMERAGLVERFARRGGGRSVFVRLTPRGERSLEKTEALADRFERSFFKGVSPAQRDRLEAELGRLIVNLREFEEELNA